MTHESTSVEETEAIAGRLAAKLRGGDVLALEGDLGAGKTQFVRGLARALGGDPRGVSSPTYVLLHVYPTRTLTIYHLDAYRVHGAADFEQIGFEELLEQGGIVVLEWPSRVPQLLPNATIRIKIETTGETSRRIEIRDPRMP